MILNIYKMNKHIPNYIYEYTKYLSLAKYPVLEQELVNSYCKSILIINYGNQESSD